ncbi:DNA replication licensing factor mcm5 [Durusdinium trenchii]|uniref:DNA replication licensing factor mcm5 n=1 Tax=Durusdinium trenchii TaxID=1381693 RepID=A0ABP0R7K8_9DINO
MDFKAVIFDLDGVLVDTEGATCAWIAQLLQPHDLLWTSDLHRHIAGTVKFFPQRCLELLEVSEVRRAELLEVLPSRLTSPEYSKFVAERMTIKAGAVALVQRLRTLQIPLALCTSRRSDGLEALMELRSDLTDLLEGLKVRVVGAIDPRNGQQMKGKPDPEVYQVCAEILGLKASECVVFEDAPSGICSAKAAGCFTIAVPESWMVGDAAAEEVFASADLRLPSLESLHETELWESLFGHLPPLLLALGNPTVDVIAVIEDLEAALQNFGLSVGSEATGFDDAQKLALAEMAQHHAGARTCAGGAAMNALRVASWAGHRRAAFIGAIGTDSGGLLIQQVLEDAGILPLLKKVPGKTGVCGVLVDGHTRDRTLSMVRAAASMLDVAWLEMPQVSCLVKEASMIYITSFVLTSQPRLAAAQALAQSAFDKGAWLCMNLSSAGLLPRVKDALIELLPKSHYLFSNSAELQAWAKLLGWSDPEPVELIRRLVAMLQPEGFAVVTAGAHPTMVAHRGEVQLFPVPNKTSAALNTAPQVSMNDFSESEDGVILHHNLINRPTEFVKLCEKALQDLYREFIQEEDVPGKVPLMQLALKTDANLDGTLGTTKPKMIRDLTSDQVEKLVVIQGIVASVKTPRDKVRKVVLKCSNCENVEEVTVESGFTAAHVPSGCKGSALRNGNYEKCPQNSFVAVGDLCEYAPDQSIRLQELPEHVPVGEMPRSIELCAQMYDVDRCTPGTRLTCIGIFCATERAAGDKLSRGRNQGTNTVKYSYIQVLGLQLAQGNQGQGALEITKDEEEQFDHMAKDPEIREMIFKSIAPAICASEKDSINQVKRAIACQLFGGARKLLPSGNRLRGDINVLLLGDPGTAKSQFLKFAHQVAPIAVYTSGKGSSAAGLTAAIVKDGGGFTLEGGAMVLADNGLVCIDEFDKMDEKDRVSIHEAMEQQTISIAKAGMTTMLNTRCSVLAAANPRFGSYDDLSNTADQMDFQTTILSRFDMMFLVKDVRDPERDYKLAKHLVALHSGAQHEEHLVPFTTQQLRKYIAYCRTKCSPRITQDGAEVLKNHYVGIRKAMKSEKATIPITVRQLEAIVRIAESLAKMEMKEAADVSHVEEALRLFTVSTLDSANRDRNGVGIDVLSDEDKKELMEAEEAQWVKPSHTIPYHREDSPGSPSRHSIML